MTATITKGSTSAVKVINITVKTVDATETEAIAADMLWLENVILNGNASLYSIISDLSLPTTGQNGSTITWSTSDVSAIAANGKITRPAYNEGDKSVLLTAVLTKGEQSSQKTFKAIVLRADGTNDDRFQEDVNWVSEDRTLGKNLSQYSIYQNLTLPAVADPNKSVITWKSDRPGVISDDGIVTRPECNENNVSVTLTATITSAIAGYDNTSTKEMKYTVLSKPDLYALRRFIASASCCQQYGN